MPIGKFLAGALSYYTSLQSTKEIREELKVPPIDKFDTVDLTVIGPFTDESKKSIGTVNLIALISLVVMFFNLLVSESILVPINLDV